MENKQTPAPEQAPEIKEGFFLRRPIFSTVISLIITLVGAIAISVLPVEQYPDLTPPQVEVNATYTGASANVIAETVASLLESQINGVDNMIDMNSVSSGTGSMSLTVSFNVGTDPDQATIDVNNRVQLALAQLPQEARNQLVVSVPSGNFGDLTAGLLAKSLGLPVKRFIAATNANDTVPRFLKDGKWAPNATQATLSNAMDVSQPNNWPRVEELFRRKIWRLGDLGYAAVTDETTKATMRELKAVGYTSEPHAAIAYRALRDQLNPGEYGLFLGTAHPAKFKESVEEILGETLSLPKELAERADLPLLSHELPADFAALRKLMMARA